MVKFDHYQVMSFFWAAAALYFIMLEIRAPSGSPAYTHAMIGVFGSLTLSLLNELLAKKENNG